MRVGSVQTVNIRQQHEQIGVNAGRDDGRERIIVADAELCDGNRVVLVDDRNRIQLQQALDRVPEILVPDWVGDIVRRQQDLCDGVAVFGEQLVVGIHQLTLTDCGGSLLGRYICRPLSEAELAHAHADRAGGDEDHLISGILEVAEHLAERFHLADVQPAGWMRDGGGADFNDNAHTGVPSSVSCCVEV